jgi:hypothetical protein
MKNNYIIYMAFIAIILSSCKPEQKKVGDSYSYLSEEQLNKTPYFNNPAFDTLIFISNKGDTLIFAKVKSVSYFNVSSRNNDPEDDSRAYSEVRHNTYQTLKGNGKFEVRHILNEGNKFNTVQIYFNDYIYGIGDWQIGLKEYVGYVGNFNVKNNTYNEVLMLENKGCLSYLNLSLGLFYIDDIPKNINYLLIK